MTASIIPLIIEYSLLGVLGGIVGHLLVGLVVRIGRKDDDER